MASNTTQFTDDFERDDENPMSTNGWTASNVQLVNGTVTVIAASPGAAFQTTTTPNDAGQEVRALVASGVEGGLVVSIGARMVQTAFVSSYGYVLKLTYSNAGARTIAFQRYAPTSPGTAYDLTAATAVTLRTSNSSNLYVLQDIRMTVTNVANGGVRLRAYVNNYDDADPDLDFTDYGKDTATSAYLQTQESAGQWMFAFSGAGAVVEEFSASDYYEIEAATEFSGRTLAQLRTAVRNVVDRSTQTNFPSATIDQYINDAHEEFFAELGDHALFMRREETMTLTTDGTRRVFMPANVDRIEAIVDSTNSTPVAFWARDMTSDGRQTIELDMWNGSGVSSAIVSYFARFEPLVADTDRTPVPRRYDEAIVVAAAVRMAETYDNQGLVVILQARLARVLGLVKKSMSRLMRQTFARMHVPPTHFRNRRTRVPWWQLGY